MVFTIYLSIYLSIYLWRRAEPIGFAVRTKMVQILLVGMELAFSSSKKEEIMEIHTLSDSEVETRLKYLTRKERELLHLVLVHIKEIETRRIFLLRGHGTMYDYLTKELYYSGSAAMRRLEASRILRDVPVVAEKIHQGTLNLAQLSELSRAIKEKRKDGVEISAQQKSELVEMISGKTTLETQKEIAQELQIKLKKPEQVRVQRDDSVHVALTFTRTQHETVMQAKDKAAHLLHENKKDHSLSSFFEILSRSYISGKMKLAAARMSGFDQATSKGLQAMNASPELSPKTITPRLRSLILARDQSCQYIDKQTGKKCGSTYGLEVDHRQAQWAGGGHAVTNLQALCSAHNKFKYQQEASIQNKE
ncbi:HNH endonuclease [Bdellovibrio sp. HCB288]|uniref:HNH endonuclease n=1 Tax=Bdellovibrio sp. HCB288 TaxID=3394355 RepID=UPI0039B5DC5B